ncbi:PAS domain-containing protein [Leptolyngbya cf. ectocarpi LEGE 11479]|uniref:PAS domain-containing protein n=1 Tax=Leptolyngbya cf. ectocarpi LEGE 11479 TaxID=1828722 RepID=A0A928ZZ52_LEPEC|nr:PAS domain-containing protein [Leptolyngbya cf. ectocarpi LEGE 11479]
MQHKKIVQINSRAASLFGQTPDELLHLPSITSLIAYEDLDRVRSGLRQCYANPHQRLTLNFGITHKSGQVVAIAAQAIAFEFHQKPAALLLLSRINEASV